MNSVQERGRQLATICKIERNRLGWKVPSQSGDGSYIVNLDHGHPFCTCPYFEQNHTTCKHIYAVQYVVQEQAKTDTANPPTVQVMRTTYGQDWPAYNAAQTNERDLFNRLLADLCMGIPQPPQTFGRPRLAMSDVVFTVVAKVYSTMSGRRFTCDLRNAEEREFIGKAPHYNSAFRYLESPDLTPILKQLIEETAKPLKALETNFAVDSSGFATRVYDRWYDEKYGRIRSENKWVKAHLMSGVLTHVVTSVEVTATETADAPQFPALVESTARNFSIREVSADKAYGSKRNLRAVEAVGGTAYIPFKSYSKGSQGQQNKFDGLWDRMWHYYTFNRAAFMEHYHKRSNIETVYSMIKGKFGGFVRSKTPDAQVNEVLCKVLCHNICVLIQSIYELNLDPIFWQERPINRN
jgi:transposase/predicted nucleic acid-binding Zn finger protein